MAQGITEIVWKWVEQHISDDPIKLRLKKDAAEHMLDIVQIECRKKAGKKLSTTLAANPRFIFGNTLAAEQSTSDMLAAYHASLIPQGAKVCDLTSGLGIDVLHLAQRASSVTAIELQPDLCRALEINAEADPKTKGKVKVICGDCRDALKDLFQTKEKPFDVIFIDPARRSATGKRLFSLHDCQPDVVEMIPLIQKACDTLIIKMSPMLDITQVCRELPSVSQIIVLGTNRECKELIAVCRWDKPEEEETEVSVVTLSSRRNDFSEGFTEGDKGNIKGDKNTEEDKGNTDGGHIVFGSNLIGAQQGYEEDLSGTQQRYGDNLLGAPEVDQDNLLGARERYGYNQGKGMYSQSSILEGNSSIKVNQFSFYPSEEAGVDGVTYVNQEEMNSWMKRLNGLSTVPKKSINTKTPKKEQSVNNKGEKDDCPSQNKREGKCLDERCGYKSEEESFSEVETERKAEEDSGISSTATNNFDACSKDTLVNKGDKGLTIDHSYGEDSVNQDEPDKEEGGVLEPDTTKGSLYLYEPSPSMMKAGAFQLLAKRFSLKMVSANSHLYLSDILVEEFPGTVWRVRRIYALNSSTIKALARQNLKGEVAVRNYPMEAEALRKKLKIGSGVGYRYMATTISDRGAYLFELETVEYEGD